MTSGHIHVLYIVHAIYTFFQTLAESQLGFIAAEDASPLGRPPRQKVEKSTRNPLCCKLKYGVVTTAINWD